MTDPTRREFLLSTGAAVGLGALAGRGAAAAPPGAPPSADAPPPAGPPSPAPDASEAPARESIPPHRGLDVPGVHLYTDRPSYAAGQTVTVYVSHTLPATLEIVRLGDDPDSPAGDAVLDCLPLDRPDPQPIHPGSYLHVARGLPAEPHAALSFECWLRPWNVHEPQGLLTQLDDRRGLGLLVFPDGTLGWFTGETDDPTKTPHRSTARLELPGGPTFSPYVTPPAAWHHVAGTVGGGRKSLWLDGRLVGQWDWKSPLVPAPVPLRIGALGRGGEAAGLLDGDIALPAVHARALTELELRTRVAERGLQLPAVDESLLGCWPLNEERGPRTADVSPHARHATVINHGTWMIGGPSFLPAVARYRPHYDPDQDRTRGHGLRLASDDLYDCRWRPTRRFALPADAAPGLYAARARFRDDEGDKLAHATFVVRRAAGTPAAPVTLLFSTNTWKAYSAAPFGPAWPGVLGNFGTAGYRREPHDPRAAYSFYRFHRAGQPTYQLGWRVPWPAASPYGLYSPPEVGYSHLARADRFTQLWLAREGYPADALSDLDLHADPAALDGTRVLFIVGHSEYWTGEAMRRVREFLDRGGHVVLLSGNTMYWRVTQSDDGGILECRKADAWGAQLADYMRGECYHEHDHRRGGVPRDGGDPEWRTVGVEFAGNGPIGGPDPGAFTVVAAEHPLFHSPEATGLAAGDRFGFDPAVPTRHPLGHESDVRVSTLMDYTRRLPPLDGLPTELVDPAGLTLLAVGRYGADGRLGTLRDYAHRILPAAARRETDSLCDVIHWRRPGGGHVFAAPSISAGWTLAVCPRWSAVLRNALAAFGVRPERQPARGT